MQSVAENQRPCIRRSPQSSVGGVGGTERAEVAGAKGITGVHWEATKMDDGFIMNSTGSEGMSCKV